MNDLMTILLGSGLVGIFITTLGNLLISLKNLHAQQKLQTQKVALDFLKDKIEELRKTRTTLSKPVSSKPYYEAIKSNDIKKLTQCVKKDISDYHEEMRAYKDIRFYFPPKNRKALDAYIRKIDLLENQIGLYLANNIESAEKDDKVPPAVLNTFGDMGKLILSFNHIFLSALDDELTSAADKLLKCV